MGKPKKRGGKKMLDPASEFLRVYADLQEIEGQTRLARAKTVQAARQSDDVRRVAESAFRDTFARTVADVEQARNGQWILLLGLDLAFGDLLYKRASGDYVKYFEGRLDRTGALSDDGSPGILLPRRGHLVDGVPLDHFGETFMNVTVVDPAQANSLHVHAINPIHDIHLGPREALKIACVPFVGAMSDLDWEHREESGYHWYEVRPKPDLANEVEALLKRLDESGAHIALLPETSLSDLILEAWLGAIEARQRPKRSKLRWILAGTGPVTLDDEDGPSRQRPNRAVLLSRDTGDVLMTHDKISPYTILPEDIERFGLQDDFGGELPDRPLHEWMSEGSATNLLSSDIGGVAVAICEDLDRVEDHLGRMISARPSYVVVPVLSNYLLEEHHCSECGEKVHDFWKWEAQRASVYASKIGCRVIVCTSLAFPTRAGVDTCATSFVMSPSPVSRWVEPEWGRSDAGSPMSPFVHKIMPKPAGRT